MRTILTSWKEIAHYLGRGVRTVQRWEAQFSLPVRRPRNGGRKAVIAIPEEIDAWVLHQNHAEKGMLSEFEIDQLRHAVTLLQAENAALKLRLDELVSVEALRKVPQAYAALPAGDGGVLHDQMSVARRSDGKRSPGNGFARKCPPTITATMRNGTTSARRQGLLLEDVEQFLRKQ